MNVGLPEDQAAWEPTRNPVETRHELDFMTDLELARAFCVTTQTLATWRRKKYGPPAVSIGKGVFYRYWDVLNWVHTQKAEGVDVGKADPQAPGEPRREPGGRKRQGSNPWSWSPGPQEPGADGGSTEEASD